MWNHKSGNSVIGDGDVELNSESGVNSVDEKLEKHVDLSNYLTYLQSLFNKPTSDSEGSDGELVNEDEVQNLGFRGSSAISASITQQDRFLSSTQEGINSGRSGGILDTFAVSSSSSSSSSYSHDEDSSFLPNDLTPMSDMELNNLLKKTNYLGPDADPIPFELEDTSTTDSDNKNNTKKKKKKSKKKNDDGLNHRHNKPNSDGKGNGSGHSGYRGDSGGNGTNNSGNSNNTDSSSPSKFGGGSTSSRLCNSRTRKQSLKFLRAEASNNSSSSSDYSLSNAQEPVGDEVTKDDQCLVINREVVGLMGKRNGKSAISKKLIGSPLSQAIHNSAAINCASSSKVSGLPMTPERLPRDDDDNNSLSDYISMAATAAATTAQVPPLPQHLGGTGDDEDDEDEDFEFDEKVFNNICMKLTGSSAVEDSIQEPNSPVSHTNNSRKRKLENDKDSHRNEEPKAKKQMVQKSEKLIELLNLKRRRIYLYLCKKEIPKSQRTMMGTHKESISAKRKLAQACTRFVRQKAIQSQKIMKESVWRAKRLTREMQTFWKQADRAEKELRRRREKQAEEQRKLDEEMLESKRHLRNLNFIITQTELYSQCTAKKLSRTSLAPDEEMDILQHLEESERGFNPNHCDRDESKKLLKLNVERAIKSQCGSVKQYFTDSVQTESSSDVGTFSLKLFKSDLKVYQIKGVQWLINLYNQGVNGIMADDLELGKITQSIAFLCHLAERRGIWGPFLIVAPSSQLQNWHQELNRLIKDFKVILYIGNPQERKTLRSSWNAPNLNKKDSAFHVVISTCQTVSADMKHFNKVSWRYLIVDEAQSLKSPSCARWKALLSFNCRNRLLLSKPPMLNGIGESWSLLHFLMPFLFDTRDEFNEWFSKDIESLVESKKLLDERGLSRLQTALTPFILRRCKRDVESGLTVIKCPLSLRQKNLYRALKRNIKKEESLFQSLKPLSNGTYSHSSSMINLVAQLRQVCNHPDLVEERHARSPFHMPKVYHYYPKFIYNDKCSNGCLPERLLEKKFSIYNPANTHQSLFSDLKTAQSYRNHRLYKVCDINIDPIEIVSENRVYEARSEWSFLRLIGVSCAEIWNTQFGSPLQRLKLLVRLSEEFQRRNEAYPSNSINFVPLTFGRYGVPRELLFIRPEESFYMWGTEKICAMSKRNLRQETSVRAMQPLIFPEFLHKTCPKVISDGREPYGICSYQKIRTRDLSGDQLVAEFDDKATDTECMRRYIKDFYPRGRSNIILPEKGSFVHDSGKLVALKKLMMQLSVGHNTLICSRTTKMINLLQEFLTQLKTPFTRLHDCDSQDSDQQKKLDGSTFLIQTHLFLKGGNLPPYDTVIFYDSDSTLASDQQIVDRALAPGHMQQLMVYRLVSKGTIEEMILLKCDDGRVKQDSFKIRDILSLIRDDDDDSKNHPKSHDLLCGGTFTGRVTSSQGIQSSPEQLENTQPSRSWNERKRNSESQVATSLISNVQLNSSYGESVEGSLPPSPNLSDEIETDFHDADYSESTFDESLGTPTSSSYFDEYGRPMDWNGDYEEDMSYISKKPKIGRGTGKRGRPPSRVRVQMREVDNGQIPIKRGPGRPRLRPVGPPNQGVRGRRPGRPPLSKKAETISSSLTPLTPSQRVFGIYSSPDINMS